MTWWRTRRSGRRVRLGTPWKWWRAACAPQQMWNEVWTWVRDQSMIRVSSGQYLTSSNGSISTGAPVMISPVELPP